jgi:hypothetical protein
MKNFFFFCFLLTAPLFLIRCSSDNGVESQKSGMQGVITFTGQWPADAEEVRIITSKKFPPVSLSDLKAGESIPTDASSYSYTQYVDPGTYHIVGVIWREKGAAWDFSSICGVYFAGGDSLLPGEVIVKSKSSITPDINITVNRSKARRLTNSKITGTMAFQGVWPDSIVNAMVVASSKDPLTQNISLLDLCFGTTIDRDSKNADYTINVMSGMYAAVGVLFFKKSGTMSMDDLYYSQNVGGMAIVDLQVGANQTVAGPDFTIKMGDVTSRITGTLSFRGTWPAAPAEVRLVTTTKFPPTLEDMIIGDAVPSDVEIYNYSMKLRADTYTLVGVIWRAESTNWDLLSICGVYFAGGDTLAPGKVVIATDTSTVKDVNIKINRSKARKITDTKIVGTITFKGTWPNEFIQARVIASTKFKLFPTELPSLLDLGFSDVITPGVASVDYVIKAFPAKFAATGVIFFKANQTLSINDILYSAQVGALDLTEYTVTENATVAGPNFEVQF